ncbi:hypothetical protein M404DRAFT_721481 [Pisolithus tinctorius Marx 270]|uniref:Uncharacterized protein n=1 Tax=Pisolithus tinctorius Marx 270 TaxID=870435 RepID=A0A0C3JWQ1_PISTI|nr:hypothetical protein M404DRAFT_721481 [Pisolithus tinctorius Marx 270]
MPLSRKISLALVTVIILSCIRVALMGVMRLFRITSCSMAYTSFRQWFNCAPRFLHQRTLTPPQVHLLMSPKPISFLFDWSLITAAEGCAPVRWAGPFFGEN